MSAEWQTVDGNVNYSDENLDGTGVQYHTSSVRMSTNAQLDKVTFKTSGIPCIIGISIRCGNQVGGGSVTIDANQIYYRWTNQDSIYRYLGSSQNDPSCIYFGYSPPENRWAVRKVTINAAALYCQTRQCVEGQMTVD